MNPPDLSSPASHQAENVANGGVHRLFEAQAERIPDACAVTCGEHGLTYRELNRRANQFARHLQSLGVGPETLVAICLERSIEAVLGLLAILKAGGAYVPLDPAYPAERLAFMLENSRARVLVTDPTLWEQGAKVKTPAELKMVYLQGYRAADCYEGGNLADPAPDAASAAPADPLDRLAYVIYTSGSTGQPKGVEMPHRPLVNLLRWQAKTCPLATGARVLQFAPMSFDVSFQEIFSTLGEGGAVALISEELRRDPRGLLRFMAESDIARAFLPPVMLHQLAEQLIDSDFAPTSLREVITAGEALRITPATVRFFAKLGGRCTLRNHYGPTETHVATAFTLNGPPESWPELPPIGKSIEGAIAELRGEDGQPAPDGEPGELFLGGDCLARGYLGAPEQTAARFLNDPHNGRFYRTGDLVKRLPDGNLQFLGRADDQVKIRGFRVELGEIEATLARHPAVEASAVGISTDTVGGQKLTGYYVPRAVGQSAPDPVELRRWLTERLPAYAVPAHLAAIGKLPLTPSGKVDRRALPRSEPLPILKENVSTAPPQTSLEKVVARLWEEVLALKNPGVKDNFFEIGGNSILAVQVHTRLCQTLQREFPIAAIFQHPTISALAKYLNPNDYADSRAAASNRLTPQERARRQQEAAASAAAARSGDSSRKP